MLILQEVLKRHAADLLHQRKEAPCRFDHHPTMGELAPRRSPCPCACSYPTDYLDEYQPPCYDVSPPHLPEGVVGEDLALCVCGEVCAGACGDTCGNVFGEVCDAACGNVCG